MQPRAHTPTRGVYDRQAPRTRARRRPACEGAGGSDAADHGPGRQRHAREDRVRASLADGVF